MYLKLKYILLYNIFYEMNFLKPPPITRQNAFVRENEYYNDNYYNDDNDNDYNDNDNDNDEYSNIRNNFLNYSGNYGHNEYSGLSSELDFDDVVYRGFSDSRRLSTVSNVSTDFGSCKQETINKNNSEKYITKHKPVEIKKMKSI